MVTGPLMKSLRWFSHLFQWRPPFLLQSVTLKALMRFLLHQQCDGLNLQVQFKTSSSAPPAANRVFPPSLLDSFLKVDGSWCRCGTAAYEKSRQSPKT